MKLKSGILLPLAALLAITACTEQGQNARQQSANGTAVSAAVSLTAQGKKLTQIGAYPSKTDLRLGTPNFVQDKKGTCLYESAAFTAQSRFGKAINLPSFGRASPDLTVTCEIEGKSYSQTVSAVNLTQLAYQSQAAGHVLFGFGIVGAAVTAGKASGRDKTKDIYGYPTIVTFQ